MERLIDSGEVEAALDAWAAERGGPVGRWRRAYARLKPGASTWAVLVYQAESGPTVGVRLLRTGDPVALGAIQIRACEDDPALPGLRAVLASLQDPSVVRYRPGNRCTVRGRVGSGVRYVKILADEVDDQREATDRWDAATAGLLSFNVAQPHGWDESTRASWYGAVAGEPLLPALSGAGARRLAEMVGRSLGELAVAPLTPDRVVTHAHQLARIERALARATAAAPALADSLQHARDALARAHGRLDERPLVPAHGAAHLGQWLVDADGRLGLVDFDRWARGEPEFDLATFCVDLETHLPSTVSTERLERAALDGFRAVAGEPDVGRLALYGMHRRLAKVARTAAALRPDAEERAARQLDGLLDQLLTLEG